MIVRRDTGTGAVMEQMVLPALERGGYEYFRQVDIGERLGGGKHVVDVVAYDPHGQGYLISMKWQQVSGTAEQKVSAPEDVARAVLWLLEGADLVTGEFIIVDGGHHLAGSTTKAR